MIHKVTAFYALSPLQKGLFLRAYYLLGMMRFAILTQPFKRLVSSLELHREAIEPTVLRPTELAAARQIGWAVCKAAQFTPWESACLVQVLAAQRMLQKGGIAGAFYLGASMQSEEERDPGMSAHAWLKCDNHFITGEPGHERFTVVSTFSWP